MAIKYTILKVLTRNLIKTNNSKKGFTLIELIIGLLIMSIVSGLAMNAFIQASKSFNDDKRNIDSSQNLSAVLEMIGNDIRQSGEQISDTNFPAIEFITNTDTGSMSGSSKIIIRRAVAASLTLCSPIAAATDPSTITQLVVADNATGTVGISANCDAGTTSSGLLVVRPNTTFTPVPATTPAATAPTPALSPILPKNLRLVRDYRCELDDPNPTVAYDNTTNVANTTADFCGSPNAALEKLRIALSDEKGHILIFNETAEAADATNTATALKYNITVNTTLDASDVAIANNVKNKAVVYPIKSPIYAIEERSYFLDNQGNLNLAVNGQPPSTLIRKIQKFNISARTFTNTTDRLINPTPSVPTADICADAPTSPTAENPKYICKLNYNADVADAAMNWKTIAGVKVELQAKYDPAGRGQEHPTDSTLDSDQVKNDKEKLKATAVYFPRNVLSK